MGGGQDGNGCLGLAGSVRVHAGLKLDKQMTFFTGIQRSAIISL